MAKNYVLLIRNCNGRIRFVEEMVSTGIPLDQAHSFLDYYRRNFGIEAAETADVLVDDGFGILVKLITAT